MLHSSHLFRKCGREECLWTSWRGSICHDREECYRQSCYFCKIIPDKDQRDFKDYLALRRSTDLISHRWSSRPLTSQKEGRMRRDEVRGIKSEGPRFLGRIASSDINYFKLPCIPDSDGCFFDRSHDFWAWEDKRDAWRGQSCDI